MGEEVGKSILRYDRLLQNNRWLIHFFDESERSRRSKIMLVDQPHDSDFKEFKDIDESIRDFQLNGEL